MGRKRSLARAALFLGSSLVGLILAEIAVRQLYGEGFGVLLDAYEDHPYRPFLSYQAAWGPAVFPVYTNSLGWRDARPDHRVEKDPGPQTRVVFLGDSFTEGVGLAYERSIPGVAESLVNAGGDRFEVLNGGRNSYSPLLEYQRLRRFFAAGYQADCVVLLPDVSDPVDELLYGARYELGPGGEPLRFREARYGPLLREVYNHSALARGLRRLQTGFAEGFREDGTPGPPPAPFIPPGPEALSTARFLALPQSSQMALRGNWGLHPPSLAGWADEGLKSMLANVGRIHRLTAERSIPLIVVAYPWPTMLYTREDPDYYGILRRRFPEPFHNREAVFGRRPGPAVSSYEAGLRDFCHRNSIPFLDLVPEIQAQPRWDKLYISGDVHFNERGARLAGERIAGVLETTLHTQ